MLWDCITSEEEGNGELKGGGENFFLLDRMKDNKSYKMMQPIEFVDF